MKTALSVNLNKIALLRNSRGRDYPNVVEFAKRFIELGVDGITVHPRPDERHIKRRDVYDLADFLKAHSHIEFNIEGNPDEQFMRLIDDVRPHQCTLVPDSASQLTSDHGFNVETSRVLLEAVSNQLAAWQVRRAVFMEPIAENMQAVASLGFERIELYTEAYANAFGTPNQVTVWQQYAHAAMQAQQCGLGVNAGHDLDLANLEQFLRIEGILEVSIGHALTVECILQGVQSVVAQYLSICHGDKKAY